jgi:hypothetical protein
MRAPEGNWGDYLDRDDGFPEFPTKLAYACSITLMSQNNVTDLGVAAVDVQGSHYVATAPRMGGSNLSIVNRRPRSTFIAVHARGGEPGFPLYLDLAAGDTFEAGLRGAAYYVHAADRGTGCGVLFKIDMTLQPRQSGVKNIEFSLHDNQRGKTHRGPGLMSQETTTASQDSEPGDT